MSQTDVSNLRRVSGALLVGSLAILMIAFAVVIITGALSAFSARLGGSLAESAPHVGTFRSGNLMYATGWIAQFLGFVALTQLLRRSDDGVLVTLALAATALATILAVLDATFHLGMTTWAAQEAASTGAEPVFYTATRRWVSAMKLLYLALGLSAQAGYGVALMKTRLIPTWVSKTAVAWGVTWLLLLMVGVGAPVILFTVPPMIGAALLSGQRIPSASANRRKE